MKKINPILALLVAFSLHLVVKSYVGLKYVGMADAVALAAIAAVYGAFQFSEFRKSIADKQAEIEMAKVKAAEVDPEIKAAQKKYELERIQLLQFQTNREYERKVMTKGAVDGKSIKF